LIWPALSFLVDAGASEAGLGVRGWLPQPGIPIPDHPGLSLLGQVDKPTFSIGN
jgi:hypothetical protein